MDGDQPERLVEVAWGVGCLPLYDFLEREPDPFLVVESLPAACPQPKHEAPAASGSGEPMKGAADDPYLTLSAKVDGSAAMNPREQMVCRLRKTDRNQFDTMIVLGRAPFNDIVVGASSVSKLHAYFLPAAGDRVFLVDAESSNGAFMEGRRLAGSEQAPLENGKAISFAGDVRMRYFTRPGFHEYLAFVRDLFPMPSKS